MNLALVPKSLLRWRAFRARSFVATLAVFVAVVSSGHAQGTMTVTFEGQTPGTRTHAFAYSEAGVNFGAPPPVTLGDFWRVGSGLSGYPDNGTAYLGVPAGAQLSFSLATGSYFNFMSFDAAEYTTDLPGSVSLAVVGYRVMGATVTNLFTTDGINDGTGTLPDFQKFFLDSQFENIYRVDIYSSRFSIDNIAISGVPEPTTGSLALVGAGGAVAWPRFRRKHRHRQTHV